MYTPQEVAEKTFPRSGLTAGYSMTAVDEFLDGLTEDYTALYKENAALKAKLKMLAEKVEEYRRNRI
jgi:cell division initiation protein